MTNKELITKLLEFPMDMEVCIDNVGSFHDSKLYKTTDISFDDGKTSIWITNYK